MALSRLDPHDEQARPETADCVSARFVPPRTRCATSHSMSSSLAVSRCREYSRTRDMRRSMVSRAGIDVDDGDGEHGHPESPRSRVRLRHTAYMKVEQDGEQQRRWDLFSHRDIHHSTCPGSPLPLLLRPPVFPSCSAWPAGGASPNHISSRRIHAIKRSYWHPCFPSVQPAHCATQEEGHRKAKSDRSDLLWDADAAPNFQQTRFSRRRRRRRRRVPFRFSSPCLGLPLVVDTGDPQTNNDGTAGPKAISAARFTSSPFRAP